MVGTFAWTRDDEDVKLKDKDVVDKDTEDKDDNDETDSESDDDDMIVEDETNPVLGGNQALGNLEQGGTNGTDAVAPVFNLDDVKVDRVEFADDVTMPDKSITDEDGSILTAVITYEYRATSDEEFTSVDEFDTTRAGEYRVTYTITNNAGLSSSESFIVTVADSTKPVIDGIADDTFTDEDVVLTISELNRYEAYLNGDVYVSGTSISEDGAYTLAVTDAAGNRSEVSFIIDKTAPAISIADGSVYNTSVTPRITEANIESVVYTKDGKEYSNDYTLESENVYRLMEAGRDGVYTITVTDKLGKVTTVTFTIDKTAPEVEVIYSTTEPTNGGVFVTLKTNEPVQEIKGFKKISDTEYQKAFGFNYTQDVTVVDLVGNETVVTITVSNIDKEAPNIRLLGNSNVTVTWGETYTDVDGISYSDNTSAQEEMTVQTWYTFKAVGETTYTEVEGIDTTKAGQYYQYYTVTDKVGNVSERVSRGILVVDEEAPVITKKVASDIYFKVGDTLPAISELVTAIDNNDGDITDRVYILRQPDMNTAGTYLVEFYVLDASGNRGYTPLRVHVSETAENASLLSNNLLMAFGIGPIIL